MSMAICIMNQNSGLVFVISPNKPKCHAVKDSVLAFCARDNPSNGSQPAHSPFDVSERHYGFADHNRLLYRASDYSRDE